MIKPILLLLLCSYCSASLAGELPALAPSRHNLPLKPFLSSSSTNNVQNFDVWKIDSGYSYNLFHSLDIYFGARIESAEEQKESGLLSGVSYQLNDRVMIRSTLHSYRYTEPQSSRVNKALGAEVSSRIKINDNLDVHATLDYQEWQQGIEVGLGFHF